MSILSLLTKDVIWTSIQRFMNITDVGWTSKKRVLGEGGNANAIVKSKSNNKNPYHLAQFPATCLDTSKWSFGFHENRSTLCKCWTKGYQIS